MQDHCHTSHTAFLAKQRAYKSTHITCMKLESESVVILHNQNLTMIIPKRYNLVLNESLRSVHLDYHQILYEARIPHPIMRGFIAPFLGNLTQFFGHATSNFAHQALNLIFHTLFQFLHERKQHFLEKTTANPLNNDYGQVHACSFRFCKRSKPYASSKRLSFDLEHLASCQKSSLFSKHFLVTWFQVFRFYT